MKADSVLPRFQPEFGDYPAMFRGLLGGVGADVSFSTYDVEHFEYPDEVGECDGYVITGSKKSVYDDEPWIHQLADYVVELHETRNETRWNLFWAPDGRACAGWSSGCR
ncbi:MAG: hypothetical protein U5O39_16125 [Gammaproteobacteria bacterium]|nr:hypothetical protein [Gammaproteobacteria bacterium]